MHLLEFKWITVELHWHSKSSEAQRQMGEGGKVRGTNAKAVREVLLEVI